MANTTNFGWETPDDTDLVKDGAAAMRTLGNSIDSSFVDLKGGTTGQVLAKNSNTDLDFVWTTDATGIPATIFDAKGDIIAATAADTASRLAVGSNGQVLTADSTTATGLKWAATSAPSAIGCYVYNSAAQTVGTTWTSLTMDTEYFDTDAIHSTSSNTSRLTVPTGLGGKWAVCARVGFYTGTSMTSKFRVLKNGSDVMQFADLQTWGGGSFEYPTEISFFIDLAAGDYIEFQAQSTFNDRDYSVRYPYGFGMMRFGA